MPWGGCTESLIDKSGAWNSIYESSTQTRENERLLERRLSPPSPLHLPAAAFDFSLVVVKYEVKPLKR